MVLEEKSVDDYPSSGGRYSGGNASSTYPPSMGPGAIMSSQPEFGDEGRKATPTSMLQQVQEIRSHYSFEVRDRTLFLGYDLNGAARRYRLPFESMPLSGASAWLLYGGPMRARVTSTFVIDTIRGSENLAHRPLTQTEAEGYAHHASRRTLYSFASSISAVWIGSILAIYGRKTMKFPFRKPQPLERYDNFPNRWLPVLKGHYARIAWQITRFNVYTILSLALIAPIYSSMGDSAMMVGLYKDQRTHEVTKSMAAALKNTNGRLQRHASNSPGVVRRPSQAGETEDENGFSTPSEQVAGNGYSDVKEYSGDTAFTDGTTDTGLVGNSQMQRREARQPSPSSFSGDSGFRQNPVRKPNPAFGNKQATRADQDFENSSDTNFIFDDGSPATGNDSDVNAGSSFSGDGGGSAWERVRRGQTRKTTQSQTTSPSGQTSHVASTGRPTSSWSKDAYDTNADSFSFSGSERDRQLAKEQAQKDFDRMLEDERRGAEGSAVTRDEGAWSRRRGE